MVRSDVVSCARSSLLAVAGLCFLSPLASCGLEREPERQAHRGDGGAAGASSRAQALGPGCTSYTYNSKDYLFCPDEPTWSQARLECQSVAMDLVKIDDAAENAFVRSHVPAFKEYWIGLTDSAQEGTWLWSQDDAPATYTNWDFGEGSSSTQDCAVIASSDGEWSDQLCNDDYDYGYVCEETAPPPPPPLPPAADTACWSSPALQANAPWPMRGLCPLRRGAGKFVGSHVNTVNWTYPTGGDIRTGVAIAADHTIVFGSDDNKIYALYPNGTKRWDYDTGGDVRSSPLITSSGAVLIGSDDDYLYSIDLATGTRNWRFNTTLDVKSSPAVAADGTIYFGSDTNKLYALSPTNGTLLWHYTTGNDIHSSPALMPDGTIVVGSDDDYVYALKPDLGLTEAQRLKWKTNVGDDVNAIPVIGPAPDHFIYVRHQNGKIRKLDPATGTILATFTGPFDIDDSSPAIGLDGDLYVGLGDNVYGLNGDDLTQKWIRPTGDDVKGSPAIGADGLVYVGSDNEKIYALDPEDGSIVWSLEATGLADYFRGTPAIAKNGAILIGNDNNRLYSIGSFECSASTPCGNGMGPCTADNECGAGLECGFGIAERYGLPADFGVCWDRDNCPDPDQCGSFRSYCGTCPAVACADVAGLQAGSPWPMHGQCPQQRGIAGGQAPVLLNELWTAEIGRVVAQPVVGADGTIYVGAEAGDFYALRPDASTLWSVSTAGGVVGSAVLAAGGQVYFGTLAHELFARNAETGAQIWTKSLSGPIQSSPHVMSDGTIFVAAGSDLYGFRPDGSVFWPGGPYDADAPIVGPIASYGDGGPLVFTTNDDRVHVVLPLATPELVTRPFLSNTVLGGVIITPHAEILVPTHEGVTMVHPLGSTPPMDFDHRPTSSPSEQFHTALLGPNGRLILMSNARIRQLYADLAFDRDYVADTVAGGFLGGIVFGGGSIIAMDSNAGITELNEFLDFVRRETTTRILTGAPSASDDCILMGTVAGLTPFCGCEEDTCAEGDACNVDSICECVPTCGPAMCGPDPNCGETCSVCPGGPATDQSECQVGLVLRFDVAHLFGQPAGTGICWAPVCDDRRSPHFECGTTSSLCGLCPDCDQDCDDKQCGFDGCWGSCGPECALGEAGCETDGDCAHGLVCMEGMGAAHGVDPDLGVCLPPECRSLDPDDNPCLDSDNQGDETVCGVCPALSPSCDGKVCGPDGAGGSCGDTPDGFTCVGGLVFRNFSGGDPDVQTAEVGTLPGDFSVSHAGEATYEMPLRLPPGRGGLTPKLALSYRSGRGNGLAGVGWVLEGMESITRCGRNVAQDDRTSPIVFDDSDAWCLNGERIVPTGHTRTVDGEELPEYALEQNDLSSIVAIPAEPSSDLNGPARFEVTRADGRVYTFGGTSSSNILAPSRFEAVHTWALSKITDRHGNYATITYTETPLEAGSEPLVREYAPLVIAYSMHESDPNAQAAVLFQYEDRPDPLSAWRSGVNLQTTRRLKKIVVVSHELNRHYVLRYVAPDPEPDIGPQQSAIAGLQECADQEFSLAALASTPEHCLPETTFTYERGGGMTGNSYAGNRDGRWDIQAVSDFNGDGRDDLLVLESANPENYPSGNLPPPQEKLLVSTYGTSGEGNFEFYTPVNCPHCEPVGGSWRVPRSPSYGGPITVAPDTENPTQMLDLQVVDWDRDGRRDDLIDMTHAVVYLLENDYEDGLIRFDRISIELGDETDPTTQLFLLDMDGDGLSDIVSCTQNDDPDADDRGVWSYALRDREASFDTPDGGVLELQWRGPHLAPSCPAIAPNAARPGWPGKELANGALGERRYYSVADLDSDGDEELLFIEDDSVGTLYSNRPEDNLDPHATVDADVDGGTRYISQPKPSRAWKILRLSVDEQLARDIEFEQTSVPWRAKSIDMNGDGLQDYYLLDSCTSYYLPSQEVCRTAGIPLVRSWINVGAQGTVRGITGTSGRFREGEPLEVLHGYSGIDQWERVEGIQRLSQALDYDGDGKQDILHPLGARWTALRSTGQTFDPNLDNLIDVPLDWAFEEDPPEGSLLIAAYWARLAREQPRTLDLNGDRLPDLLAIEPDDDDGSNLRFLFGSGPFQPRLVGVTNGLGEHVQIGYATLSTDLHSREPMAGSEPCGYPQTCTPPRGAVVSTYSVGSEPSASDPDGDVIRTYTELYRDARSDVQGRGFLGFGSRTERMETGDPCPGFLPGEVCPEDVEPEPGVPAVALHVTEYTFANTVREPTTGVYYMAMVPSDVTHARADADLTYAKVVESGLVAEVLDSAPNSVYRRESERREQVFEIHAADNSTRLVSDTFRATPSIDEFGNPRTTFEGLTDIDFTDEFPCRIDVSEGCTMRALTYEYESNAAFEEPGLRNLPSLEVVSFLQTQSARPWHEDDLGFPIVSNIRTSAFGYDANGALDTTELEPGADAFDDKDSLYRLIDLDRDDFGNVTSRAETAGVSDPETRTQSTEFSDPDLAPGWFPSATIDALGQRTELVYDTRFGQVLQSSTAATSDPGVLTITQYRYDDFGRRVVSVDPDGTLTTVTYSRVDDARPLRVRTLVEGGPDAVAEHDIYGRVVHSTTRGARGTDLVSDIAYDDLDRAIARTRPHYPGAVSESLATIEATYDVRGRQLTKSWFDGTTGTARRVTSETCYAGRDQCTRNARGFTSCTTSDQRGRVVKAWDPTPVTDVETVPPEALPACRTELLDVPNRVGASVAYRYGEFLEGVQDALGNFTVIELDRYGRRTLLNDPDSGVNTSKWNAFGELVETIDGNDQRTEFAYDDLGRRVLRVDHPLSGSGDPEETRWFYDGADPDAARDGLGAGDYYGALSASQSPEGHVKRYSYNDVGQVTRIEQELSGDDPRAITFGDYLHGQPQAIGYPGFGVRRTYGTNGHLLQVWHEFAGAFWTLQQTDAFDVPQVETFGNGVRSEYERDNLSRIGAITDEDADGDVLRELTFTHDDNGNVKTRADTGSGQIEAFGYDQLDRLTTSTVGTSERVVDYDALGNMSFRTELGTYQYLAPAPALQLPDVIIVDREKPHAVSHAGDLRYQYDDLGNQVWREDTVSDEVEQLSWTPFGKVREIWRGTGGPSGGSGTVTLGYDADGRRARKDADGLTTTYLEDLYERREHDNGDVDEVFYVTNSARVVAQVTAKTVSSTTQPPEILFLHGDVVGSAELMTTADGTALPSRSYDAFGASRSATDWRADPVAETEPALDVRLGFTGHETDSEFALVNMKGRLYDPKLGRFLSADPFAGLGSQDLNRYSYVRNNPLKYVDPSGYAHDYPGDAGGGGDPAADPGLAPEGVDGEESGGEESGGGGYGGWDPEPADAANGDVEPAHSDPTGPEDADSAELDTAGAPGSPEVWSIYSGGGDGGFVSYPVLGTQSQTDMVMSAERLGVLIGSGLLVAGLATYEAGWYIATRYPEVLAGATALANAETTGVVDVVPPAPALGAASRAGGRLLPTLGNLGDDAAGTVLGKLTEGGGGYRVGEQVAEGTFDFVVQEGQIILGKGHAALSGDGRVTYAGEITFRGGQIVEWTNASGHFRPSAAFAGNAGLPMESFRAVNFPSLVGGPQLPVFQ